VAVIGASADPDKVGGRPIDYLKRFGFGGEIHPVNPTRTVVQGFPAFARVGDIHPTPDVALIAVPGPSAVQAVEECAAAGVKAVVVMTAGFGETSSIEGRAQQQTMVATARGAGMRLVGPNSQGLANFGTGAVLGFSTMFKEEEPLDGPVAIVSQSGAMCSVPYGLLRRRGIGIRYAHATGNDGDVTVGELAESVLTDPAVELLILYLEDLSAPAALASAARTARVRSIPVVALMGGRSADGQRAAAAHTGALASEQKMVDAFFRKHGIWRARSMREVVDTTELYLQRCTPRGKSVVVVSNSGAVCVLASDAVSDHGLTLSTFSADTRRDLEAVLPAFATKTNPVDVTAALLTDSGLFGKALPIIAADASADAFLIGIPVAGAGYDIDRFASDAAAFAEQTNKPLVIAAPQRSVGEAFRRRNLVVFDDETTAIAALAQFLSHHELMADVASSNPALPRPHRNASAQAPSVHTLDEAASLRLLSDHLVPVVAHRLCMTAQEAAEAFLALGSGKVVVKGCTVDTGHKSEFGLVELGLDTVVGVTEAFTRLRRRMSECGFTFGGVIVAEMVKGLHEGLVGAHRDPIFGPVVVVGQGGKYVEALPDTQVLLPPFSRTEAVQAIGRLRMTPVLRGVRGEPAADVESWADLAVAVSRVMAGDAPTVESLDANPVIVGPRGMGCTVVDALVVSRR
jgi:acyl-CoA synthetase (NDP forming)